MRHQQFAEQAARKLEYMAEASDQNRLPGVGGITETRAAELRVAARVVRDLSEIATREERRSSEERLPLEVPY